MLGTAGYDVDLVASEHPAPGHWSRFCGRRLAAVDPRDDPSAFVGELERLTAGGDYDVLLPGSDATLLAIACHGESLRDQVEMGLPTSDVIERALSKVALNEHAIGVGHPPPETVVCEEASDAIVAARLFGYPVVLKPRSSIYEHWERLRQRGSVTVADEPALMRRLAEFGTPCLVQRREGGRVVSLGGVMVEGELIAAVASCYHRTWRPDAGSASYSETIPLTPYLERTVSDIISSLGWQGIFELELLERADGRLLPIDLNPRVYGSLALAAAAGVPLATIWCDRLRAADPARAASAAPGQRYRWEDADFLNLAWRLARGDVRAALAIARPRRRTVHAHLWASDPLPAAARATLMVKHRRARARANTPATLEDPAHVLWAPKRPLRARERRGSGERGRRVAVIGAGPYGLAAAAFCRRLGATVQSFGRPMEFWLQGMPAGMLLRSRWRSSHIADPTSSLSLDAYERVIGRTLPDHIAIADYIEYGRWYQRAAVPDLDERMVQSVERDGGRFGLTLDDGEVAEADAVIVAAGLNPFARRPAPFAGVAADRITHAVDHRDLSIFRDQRVLVIGAGQSALESAVLLRETGAQVEVLARGEALAFLAPEEITSLAQRVNRAIAPPTDVGGRLSGWAVAAPDVWRLLPPATRMTLSTRALRPRGADWLRSRLEGVTVTLGRRAVSAAAENGGVRVALDDGTDRHVDHVLLGTGYEIDVAGYRFLGADLLAGLERVDGHPVLARGLESSIPGLHFVGAPAARSFGAIMRFVVGTWYAAPAVAEAAAATRRRPLRLAYRPRRPWRAGAHARPSLPVAEGNGRGPAPVSGAQDVAGAATRTGDR